MAARGTSSAARAAWRAHAERHAAARAARSSEHQNGWLPARTTKGLWHPHCESEANDSEKGLIIQ